MMNRRCKILVIPLLLIIIYTFVIPTQEISAHRMVIERVEEGLIHVRYDDGTNADLAVVESFDEAGNLLFRRQVNDAGQLEYDAGLDVYRFVAMDGLGHRAVSVTQKQMNSLETIPTWAKALVGVSFLLFVAAIFYFRSSKK